LPAFSQRSKPHRLNRSLICRLTERLGDIVLNPAAFGAVFQCLRHAEDEVVMVGCSPARLLLEGDARSSLLAHLLLSRLLVLHAFGRNECVAQGASRLLAAMMIGTRFPELPREMRNAYHNLVTAQLRDNSTNMVRTKALALYVENSHAYCASRVAPMLMTLPGCSVAGCLIVCEEQHGEDTTQYRLQLLGVSQPLVCARKHITHRALPCSALY
jgi:hypothetical protein